MPGPLSIALTLASGAWSLYQTAKAKARALAKVIFEKRTEQADSSLKEAKTVEEKTSADQAVLSVIDSLRD